MRRVLAAETASMKRTLTDVKRMAREASGPAGGDEPTFGEKWLGRATDPLFQLQDTVNTRADRFMRLCEAFEVPINQYAKVQQSWKKDDRKPATSVYNPVGGIISTIDASSTYVQYILRAASVEGMRRAALLAVQLHAGGIAPEAAGEAVASAELRDPYTDKPFEWNAGRRSVIFTALETHQWRRYGILLLRRRVHFFFGFGLPYFFSYSSRIFSYASRCLRFSASTLSRSTMYSCVWI